MIERAAASNPNTRWWIKADGVNVVKGLWESVRGEWAGDVDLADGQLQLLYHKLKERLLWIGGIGLEQRVHTDTVRDDLTTALEDVSSDLTFVLSRKHKVQYML